MLPRSRITSELLTCTIAQCFREIMRLRVMTTSQSGWRPMKTIALSIGIVIPVPLLGSRKTFMCGAALVRQAVERIPAARRSSVRERQRNASARIWRADDRPGAIC